MEIHEEWSPENGLLPDGSGNEPPRRLSALSPSSSSRPSSEKYPKPPMASTLHGRLLLNIQEVIFGTKLCFLLPAFPLSVVARQFNLGRPWIFALSLLGLAPLAERVSFLTEQLAHYTGPTVGGLLNATCGNATELIIAILALYQRKIYVLKCTLLGSILSNLLLVLGSSLLVGGLANLAEEQRFDRNQAGINVLLLSMALLCHLLPLLLKYDVAEGAFSAARSSLQLSRASGIAMLVAYAAYLFFQLKRHHPFSEAEQGDREAGDDEVKAPIGFWSAFTWLFGMTMSIAVLSEYIVSTIEAASNSWGISMSFLSIILLPIVGNAAEHAGALIFAFKDKLDLSLSVALGSATQISMFVVPLCVIIAWIIGTPMDLELGLLETGSLALSMLMLAFVLQDGTSHYLKGVVVLLFYWVISSCFFVLKSPHNPSDVIDVEFGPFDESFAA